MKPLDLSDRAGLLRAFGVDPVSLALKFAATVQGVRTNWLSIAKNELKSSEGAYTGAIQAETYKLQGPFMIGYIALVGSFPNMVEWGHAPWDLRDTLLKSSKTKVSKTIYSKSGKVIKEGGHRYLSIPFRQMMPGATGRNASVIGEPYRKQGGPMSELMATSIALNVAKAARAMKPTIVRGNFMGKPTDMRMNAGGSRALDAEALGVPKLRDRHVTNLYQGMTKTTDATGKKPQNTYGTFRMISDNPNSMRSDTGGPNWTHPGFQARGLMGKAADTVSDLAAAIWRT